MYIIGSLIRSNKSTPFGLPQAGMLVAFKMLAISTVLYLKPVSGSILLVSDIVMFLIENSIINYSFFKDLIQKIENINALKKWAIWHLN
jgi:hypothetical protein